MEKLSKAEYSPEFREQAVWTYQESGLSVAEVAKRLPTPKSSLNNWVMAAKKGKLASVGKNQKPVTEKSSIQNRNFKASIRYEVSRNRQSFFKRFGKARIEFGR